MKSVDLFPFLPEIIRELEATNKNRTIRTYYSVIKSFNEFNQGKIYALEDLTGELVADYQAYLFEKGLKENTVSFYIRNLEAIYNRAWKRGVIRNKSYSCFGHAHKINVESPMELLHPGTINRLLRIEPEDKLLCFTRDLFLLNFYCRVSIPQMAEIRKTAFKRKYLYFSDKEPLFSVKLNVYIRGLVKRYEKNTLGTPYLLPFLYNRKGELISYDAALRSYNNRLKRLSELVLYNRLLYPSMPYYSWVTLLDRVKGEYNLKEISGMNSFSGMLDLYTRLYNIYQKRIGADGEKTLKKERS